MKNIKNQNKGIKIEENLKHNNNKKKSQNRKKNESKDGNITKHQSDENGKANDIDHITNGRKNKRNNNIKHHI